MSPPFTLVRLLPLYLALALVTFLPRYLPMAILTRLKRWGWLERWLSFVPTAILAALTAQSLLVQDAAVRIQPARLLAAMPAGLVAWRTRNLFLTVLTGILAAAVIRWVR